ncbi:MOSC domain-containing protein [Rhizobiaceae bacterium BDR2-2]|uniref:MOSC domain-containing protein n=1 Tax=Ectorhizobium quercum TaxID=2965071 RepID=A0AAE3MVF9_9HYPH|nr:MOSC domain-containing protein [Ectorhizobium quercum]MCX8995614.1 MOSC domain-containing protein [Ectorhizobium quercum]
MKLTAICLGRPERLPGKSYKTGIGKMPVNAPMMIDTLGLVGDAVCNARHHGGPDQAILLEGSLTMDWWAERLGRPVPPGMFGENLVIDGLDNRDVAAGDRFLIGEVVLEAASPRVPCNTLAARMGDPGFARLYAQAARPGIYCRVVRGGVLEAGQAVALQPYAGERVGMAELLSGLARDLSAEDRRRHLSAPLGVRFRALVEAPKR